MSKFPQETKDLAIKMAESGKTKREISNSLKVSFYTIHNWVHGHCPTRKYPQETKEKARKLVMNGTTRKDAAFILGESIPNIYAWTRDIKVPRKRTTSKQENIMKVLAEQGYYIPSNQSDLGTLRILKDKHGIRLCQVKQTHIAIIKGREVDALKGFLRKKKIHYISSQELSQIERAFGLKDTKTVKAELETNNVKLTDYI